MPERFSASVAARHMACHASANLDLAIPNWTPPVEDLAKDNAANRGTAMHEIFAKVMELPAKDIEKISTDDKDYQFTYVDLEMLVRNRVHLAHIMKRLRSISSVRKVTRIKN